MGKGEKSKWELATCCQSVWRRGKWHNGVNEAVPGSLQGGMMMESKPVFTIQNARKFGNLETAWTAKGQRRTSRLKTQELIESLIQNIRPQTPPTPTSCCQETAPLPFSMGLEVQIQALRIPVGAEWRSEASGWNKNLVKVCRLNSETLQAAPSPWLASRSSPAGSIPSSSHCHQHTYRSQDSSLEKWNCLRENGYRYWHPDHVVSPQWKTQFASDPPG